MSATHRAMIGTGDRWLADAELAFNEGRMDEATAAGTIAGAYFARAADERPDTFAELIRLSSQAQKPGVGGGGGVDASMARHPAGGVGYGGGGGGQPAPRPIRDNPQA